MAENVEVGQFVKWTPPDEDLRASVPLHRDHPGLVIAVGPMHILIDWVDRRHTMADESNYEAEWLTRIDQVEFDRLAAEVRRLDRMEGSGRHAGPSGFGEVDEGVQVGHWVKWTPPDEDLRASVPLYRDHPGVVAHVGPKHILIDWVDRRHTTADQSNYKAEWLTRIDQAEYDRLAQHVRKLDRMEGSDRQADPSGFEEPDT